MKTPIIATEWKRIDDETARFCDDCAHRLMYYEDGAFLCGFWRHVTGEYLSTKVGRVSECFCGVNGKCWKAKVKKAPWYRGIFKTKEKT